LTIFADGEETMSKLVIVGVDRRGEASVADARAARFAGAVQA
jgi:hypothetical protein